MTNFDIINKTADRLKTESYFLLFEIQIQRIAWSRSITKGYA
jgi:hypothetical protein